MTSSMMRGVRRSFMLLATGTILIAPPAGAQGAQYPPGAVVQPLGDGAGAELRRQLTILAENPRSLSALIGAGRAALQLRDAQAALAFFARADEVSPRDARVKAGMASAMVQMEQPQSALSLFAEAVALGAPEVEIASDRGLAFDMVGDPRRAQQDYALALRRGDDPEVRRRMALSLAISGHREAALNMIAAQLRQGDRAALRTRAFILALTGDAAGASEAARSQMPPHALQAMAPFFARLGSLAPAQKAMAVHFGHFPSDGRVLASSGVDTSAHPDAVSMAGSRTQTASDQAGGIRQRSRTVEPVSRAPRRRPGTSEQAVERVGPGSRPPLPSSRRRPPAQVAQLDARRAEPQPRQQSPQQPVQPPVQQPPVVTSPPSSGSARPSFDLAQAGPSEEPASSPPASVPQPQPAQSGPPAPAPAERERPDLDDIAALVEALPQEEPIPPAPTPPPPRTEPQPQRPTQTASREARPARQSAVRPRATAPAHPSRYWVQVAGGADKTALPREYARLRALAPSLLGTRTAWTTPLRATNRLLVGPFPSADAAQDFVNQLARHDVAGFAWTSPAGQEIERLPAGR